MFARRTLRTAAVLLATALALTSFASAQAASGGPGGAAASSRGGTDIRLMSGWDYYSDFVANAAGWNPPSGSIWTYRVGNPGAPQSSTLLPSYIHGQSGIPALSTWFNTGYPIQQPRVSVNTGSVPVTGAGDCGTVTLPPTKGFLHPYDASHAAIIAWTSPVTRWVKIQLKLKLAEVPICGSANGVTWALWKNGVQMSGQSGTVTPGPQVNVSTAASVVTGDVIYLVVDSGAGNYTSDDTSVVFRLH